MIARISFDASAETILPSVSCSISHTTVSYTHLDVYKRQGMTVAALVAGNTVVLKPSSDTPTVAAKFVAVLAEAGFPAECCTLLVGAGGEIGDLLVAHPRTRFVSFTGSREVGLRINELAALSLIHI